MKLLISLIPLIPKIIKALDWLKKFLEKEILRREDVKTKKAIEDAFGEKNKKKSAALLNNIFRK